MLSNRVDILSHVDGRTSLKIQMTEYFTETKGFPEKRRNISFGFVKVSNRFFKYTENTGFYKTPNQIVKNTKKLR